MADSTNRESAGKQVAGHPQRDVVAWVFQGNPSLYDIDTYLSRQTFIYWNCPILSELMKIGMPVFF